MIIKPTSIPGCYQIFPVIHKDSRGSFVKTFHQTEFKKNNLITEFAEEYYSISHKGVLRGLHFQTPPHDHFKMVYCLAGSVFDVILDLRVGSPTYGQHESFLLTAELGNMIYIIPGIAHGFYSLEDNTVMQYKVSSVYAPQHDTGLCWNSLGIDWPDTSPLISERDSNLPEFSKFNSPFLYAYD